MNQTTTQNTTKNADTQAVSNAKKKHDDNRQSNKAKIL